MQAADLVLRDIIRARQMRTQRVEYRVPMLLVAHAACLHLCAYFAELDGRTAFDR